MNEDDLKRIEVALGRPLPQVFRQVMLHFPQELIDAARRTDGDGNEFMDEMMISPDAEWIRNWIVEPWPDWPANMILVGENGCGDYFSIDIADDKCPVYCSGPHNDTGAESPKEEGYFERVSDELEGWVRHLVKQTR